MTDFELAAIQPGAAPQWQGRKHHDGMTVMVTVLPVGWVGAWHENPAPQWIIPLSGTWSVEAMDGIRREFGPGDISFGEDQGCEEVEGRKGHRSTTVGDLPATLMIVQFDTSRDKTTPCRFG
ncbi:cupin domain-containing protein [Limimaricola litoreus]|nr:cupin domain-containing protein [Limimaricola litoreus]